MYISPLEYIYFLVYSEYLSLTKAGFTFIGFILLIALSPYFSGMQIGPTTIPSFPHKTNKWLKLCGPILFVFAIYLNIPSIPFIH